jgi:hypothetical protein
MKHSLPAALWRCEAAMILANDVDGCRENSTREGTGQRKGEHEISFRRLSLEPTAGTEPYNAIFKQPTVAETGLRFAIGDLSSTIRSALQ